MSESKEINILAIESSCDETAAAVVRNGREVRSNIISSQIDLHKLYGGVVPEIASRKHIEKINQVIEEALKEAEVTLDDLDARTLAKADPKYFLEQYGYPLIIDEIQYASNLLPYIKIIVDEYRLKSLKNNTKQKALFWLIGSQQFRLMKDVSESLAGRIGVLNLYSLSNSEINKSNVGLFSPKLDVLKEKQKNRIFN